MSSMIRTIVSLLRHLVGGDRGVLTEGALLANSFLGTGNAGVSAYAINSANLRRHGMFGTAADGSLGMIGGSDVVSSHVASLLQKQVAERFMDPSTGRTMRGAESLSPLELHKASGLAMQMGRHFVNAPDVTQQRGGDFNVNLAGFEQEIQKTAGLLASIKGFLGGEALKNLDRTIADLYGNSLPALGVERARSQLERLKTFSTSVNRENPMAGFSFIHDGARGVLAQAMAGPGVSRQEALYRFGGIAGDAALNAGIVGLAASQQDLAVSNYGGPGRFLHARSLEDVTLARVQGIGQITQEEPEAMVGAFVARMQGGEAQDEYRTLQSQLVSAGADPVKRRAAKQRMAEFVHRRSGMTVGQHDQFAIREMPGVQMDMLDMANDIGDRRSQETTRRRMMRGAKTFGMTPEEAGIVGIGFANLSMPEQKALVGALGNPEQVHQVMSGSAGRSLTRAGVDRHDFTRRVASGQFDQNQLEGAARFSSTIPHFVSAGALREAQMNQLAETIDGLRGSEDQVDVVESLLRGVMGENVIHPGEILRGMDDTSYHLEVDEEGRLARTDRNRRAMRQILGEDVDLTTAVGQQEAIAKLQGKGKVSIEDVGGRQRMIFADQQKFDEASQRAHETQRRDALKTFADTIGTDRPGLGARLQREWDSLEPDQKTQEKFSELVRRSFGDDPVDSFAKGISEAAMDGDDEALKRFSGLAKNHMSDTEREELAEKLDKEWEQASRDFLEASATRAGLEEGTEKDEARDKETEARKRRDRIDKIYKDLVPEEQRTSTMRVGRLIVTNMESPSGTPSEE